MLAHVQGSKGREVGRQVGGDDLKEADGTREVFQVVLAQIPEDDPRRKVLLNQKRGRS